MYTLRPPHSVFRTEGDARPAASVTISGWRPCSVAAGGAPLSAHHEALGPGGLGAGPGRLAASPGSLLRLDGVADVLWRDGSVNTYGRLPAKQGIGHRRNTQVPRPSGRAGPVWHRRAHRVARLALGATLQVDARALPLPLQVLAPPHASSWCLHQPAPDCRHDPSEGRAIAWLGRSPSGPSSPCCRHAWAEATRGLHALRCLL